MKKRYLSYQDTIDFLEGVKDVPIYWVEEPMFSWTQFVTSGPLDPSPPLSLGFVEGLGWLDSIKILSGKSYKTQDNWLAGFNQV